MTIKITNGILNLADLQHKSDEAIFDYIDSKPNWEKAHAILDDFLEGTTKYFIDYVKKNDGHLPKVSSYWIWFVVLNAKLIYFTTLALKNCNQKSKSITNELLANRFEIASKCLTNIESEENELFLQEIKASFELVAVDTTFEGMNARTVEDSLNDFYEFAKEY